MDEIDRQKRAAALAAVDEVAGGMRLGLGTGSTVAVFVPELARRGLDLRCVATSIATEEQARELGLAVEEFESLDRLDLAVDGADQVTPDLWLVKGGGGAHTREKVVAAAADRFLVIVSADKLVDAVGPPIPLEVLPFGLPATLRRLRELGPAEPRDGAPRSPDGGVIVDYRGEVGDPARLASELSAIPGVVEHGLFEPGLVGEVIVGLDDGSVDRLTGAP